jgi:hypothetical protein
MRRRYGYIIGMNQLTIGVSSTISRAEQHQISSPNEESIGSDVDDSYLYHGMIWVHLPQLQLVRGFVYEPDVGFKWFRNTRGEPEGCLGLW